MRMVAMGLLLAAGTALPTLCQAQDVEHHGRGDGGHRHGDGGRPGGAAPAPPGGPAPAPAAQPRPAPPSPQPGFGGRGSERFDGGRFDGRRFGGDRPGMDRPGTVPNGGPNGGMERPRPGPGGWNHDGPRPDRGAPPGAPGAGGDRTRPGGPGDRGGPPVAPGSGGYRPQPGQNGYRPQPGSGGFASQPGGFDRRGGGWRPQPGPGGFPPQGGRFDGRGDGWRSQPGQPAFRPGAPGGSWNRGWRDDRRYDFRSYRVQNNYVFHLGRYDAPRGWSYGYRRFAPGFALNAFLFDQDYWIDDPYAYRLPPVWGPYRWVRYYDDALLVDIRSGVVVDAVYGIFW